MLTLQDLKLIAKAVVCYPDSIKMTLVFDVKGWSKVLGSMPSRVSLLTKPEPKRFIAGYGIFCRPQYTYDFNDPSYRKAIEEYEDNLKMALAMDAEVYNKRTLEYHGPEGPITLALEGFSDVN